MFAAGLKVVMLALERRFARLLRGGRLLAVVVVELAVSLDDFVLAPSSRKGFNPDDVTAFDFNGDDFLGDFSLKPGRFTPDVARLVLMTMRGDSCTCAAHLFALPSRTGVTSRGRSCT